MSPRWSRCSPNAPCSCEGSRRRGEGTGPEADQVARRVGREARGRGPHSEESSPRLPPRGLIVSPFPRPCKRQRDYGMRAGASPCRIRRVCSATSTPRSCSSPAAGSSSTSRTAVRSRMVSPDRSNVIGQRCVERVGGLEIELVAEHHHELGDNLVADLDAGDQHATRQDTTLRAAQTSCPFRACRCMRLPGGRLHRPVTERRPAVAWAAFPGRVLG
jgi:hypothetical protein